MDHFVKGTSRTWNTLLREEVEHGTLCYGGEVEHGTLC